MVSWIRLYLPYMKMHSRSAHLCTSASEVDRHPETTWAVSVLSQGLMLQWGRDAERLVWGGSCLFLQPYWSAFPPPACLLSCEIPLNIQSPRGPPNPPTGPSQHRGHRMVIVYLLSSLHRTGNALESRGCISFISKSSETRKCFKVRTQWIHF